MAVEIQDSCISEKKFLSDDEIGEVLEVGGKVCDKILGDKKELFVKKYLDNNNYLKKYLEKETYFFNQACEKILGLNPYGFLIPIDKYLEKTGDVEGTLDKIELEIQNNIKSKIEENKKNIENLEGLLEIFKGKKVQKSGSRGGGGGGR